MERKELPALPEFLGPPINDNAYVWLLMKGDSYLPGIVVSVYSVLRTSPNADLVVMVTPDVSEKAVSIIKKYATHIANVPYLTFDTAPMKTEKQKKLYNKWFTSAYTKWNMLALPYKKAIFIDADIVCTCNSDELFELKAPAAPFNSPFMKPLGLIKSFEPEQKGARYFDHGEVVKRRSIENMLHKGGIVFTATSILLEPNLDDYRSYIEMVKSHQPYGKHLNCHSAPDERSIAEFYINVKKCDWINIHHRFNYIGWKDGFLPSLTIPVMIHYFSDVKPWHLNYDKYDDVVSWYKMAAAAIKLKGISAEDILLKPADVAAAEKAQDTYVRKFTKNQKIKDVLDIALCEK